MGAVIHNVMVLLSCGLVCYSSSFLPVLSVSRFFLHNTFSLSLLTTSLSLSWLLQSSAWSSLVSDCGLHRLHDWVVLVRWNGFFELRALLDRYVGFFRVPTLGGIRYCISSVVLAGSCFRQPFTFELGVRAVSFFFVGLLVIIFTALQLLSLLVLDVEFSEFLLWNGYTLVFFC